MIFSEIQKAPLAGRYMAAATLMLSVSPVIFAATQPTSMAVPEAQGRVIMGNDNKKLQVRYPGWQTTDYSQYPTHSYTNKVKPIPVHVLSPKAFSKGDPSKGRDTWLTAACNNCHTLPGVAIGDTRWAGDLGPDLGGYGSRGNDPRRTFQVIYDARAFNPASIMPPWGASGILSLQDVANLTAFLHSVKTSTVGTPDVRQSPGLRDKPENYFGDNLDATRNPAALLAERGFTHWNANGPKQKSCASCHGVNLEQAMQGKAIGFPRYDKKYKRIVSIEDFLALHGVETTGISLPLEGKGNLYLASLIKMQSHDLPLQINLDDENHRAAWERGKQTFYKRIGQRNQACADCHSPEQVRGKWLGGRYISRADVSLGLTRTYPAWRTSFGEIWGLRRRVQWCMLPAGANNLAADSVEYAELEFFMATFEKGLNMNAPGLKD